MKRPAEDRSARGVALAEDDDGSVYGSLTGAAVHFGDLTVLVDVEVRVTPAGGWTPETRDRFRAACAAGGSFARGELRQGLAGVVGKAGTEAALELERRQM